MSPQSFSAYMVFAVSEALTVKRIFPMHILESGSAHSKHSFQCFPIKKQGFFPEQFGQ